MTFTRSYEAIARAMGHEPYRCLLCPHISRNTFGMAVHHLFGEHEVQG